METHSELCKSSPSTRPFPRVPIHVGRLGIGLLALAGAVPLPSLEAAPGPSVGHVLARGADFHGTNGLAFDSRDVLYVASIAGREVIALDSASGLTIDRLGPDRGVEGPDGIAIGPDGDIYFTSFFTGEVVRIAPQGGRKGAQVIASGVNPIAFSSSGRLFVGSFFFSSGLYELDPELSSPTRVVVPPGDPAEGFNGMDFGPDGLLYAPQPLLGRVVRLDVDAEPAALEVLAAGLANPIALKFDSAGRLHVLDAATGGVILLDPATGGAKILATLQPGIDNLAFDSRDRLFVSSTWDGFIAQVLHGGRVRMVRTGGMIIPGGVAVLPLKGPSIGPSPIARDSVFVADAFKLRQFDGLTGASRSESAIPLTSLTVSPDGDHLLITSWFGNAVYLFDPTAQSVVEVFPEFPVPINAIRFRDSLVVADVGTGVPRVTLRRPSGELSVLAAADNQSIFLPAGLAATDESLWFADWGSGIVWQLARGGGSDPAGAGRVRPGVARWTRPVSARKAPCGGVRGGAALAGQHRDRRGDAGGRRPPHRRAGRTRDPSPLGVHGGRRRIGRGRLRRQRDREPPLPLHPEAHRRRRREPRPASRLERCRLDPDALVHATKPGRLPGGCRRQR